MQSRGIAANEARDLLTYAFVAELLDRMRWEPVRSPLSHELYRILARSREGGAA
jgi:Fe-S cluster assembly scaffold protein SufB